MGLTKTQFIVDKFEIKTPHFFDLEIYAPIA